MGHVLMWGNAYAEIEFNNAGRPIALWPLRPDRVTPRRTPGGELYYEVRSSSGGVVNLLPDRILHFKGLGEDGLVGYSVIHMARESIGLGLATERFGAKFFGSGAQPGAVLQHPQKLSDAAYDRLKADREARHAGLDHAHELMILEEGMTWEKIGIPPEDAQFLETRKFQVTDIARWFNVPPHKLKDLERATFSNIEEQNIEFVQDSLLPWLITIEQECDYKLFSPSEREELFVEHVVSGLLRGDTQRRFAAYAVGRQWGWLSANDVREMENMNPLPDEQGDVYMVPVNMASADQVSSQSAIGQRKALDLILHAHRYLLNQCGQRILRKETLALRRIADGGGEDDPTGIMDKLYRDHADYVVELLEPAVIALASAVSAVRTCVIPPGFMQRIAQAHVAESRRQLMVKDESHVRSPAHLRTLLDEWNAHRSEEMAENIIQELLSKGAAHVSSQ